MSKYSKFFSILSYKIIYFNFKYLPFNQAIKFPFFISKNVYFRSLKGKITIDSPISSGMIKIGFGDVGIFDDRRSRSILDINGSLIFKGSANIGHGSKISVSEKGTLTLGDNFTITAESSIVAHLNIEFGKDCLLSWDTLIMDTDLHKIHNELGERINEEQPIKIGNNVWIGCRNLVLKGAVIPDNAVLGANSVVSKKLEVENAIYVGNPVRCVKENINWKL
ncbi:acyltransferase [Flavobacterium sp.]|uniref:acyltransferase n=1 Tax=Flavobacterium sp. TaxID=239 RepID=UPI00260C261E|nr:acyltransferase [Flavobacterium sp.]